MKKKLYLLIFLTSIVLLSCTNEIKKEVESVKPDWNKEESINMQSVFVEEEEDEINSFLKRHPDWNMTKTGTGLRYFIYEKSENRDTALIYDEVIVDFKIELLDGTKCYSSKANGPESFMIEKTDIESGLHEALKFMCTNDKALFILPSHLAHGLIGDYDQIPPLVPIIYDIHLIEINHQNETN
jgi:FKBP-type peptidyl-prolyl cis-trans isomerase